MKFNLGILNTGVFLVLEKIVRMLSAFLTFSLVAKYYDTEVFGIYAYHMAIFSILVVIVSFGTDQIIVFKTSNNKNFKLINIFLVRVSTSILSILVLLILSLFGIVHSEYVSFLCVSLLLQSVLILLPYYQARLLYGKLSLFISFSVIMSGWIKFLIIKNSGVNILPTLIVMDSIFISLTVILFFLLTFKNEKHAYLPSLYDIKKLFRDSAPLFFSAIAIVLYSRIDQLMINEFLGEKSVALYSSALKISELFTFILPIAVTLSVKFVASKGGDIKEAVYLKLFKLMNIYSILSITLIISFGDTALHLLFGHEFIKAYDVLIVNSVSLFFIVIGSISNVWLIENNLQKYKIIRITIGLFINVILNFYLIPIYGLYGAATSTLISQIFASFISNYFNKNTRVLFYMQIKSLGVYKF